MVRTSRQKSTAISSDNYNLIRGFIAYYRYSTKLQEHLNSFGVRHESMQRVFSQIISDIDESEIKSFDLDDYLVKDFAPGTAIKQARKQQPKSSEDVIVDEDPTIHSAESEPSIIRRKGVSYTRSHRALSQMEEDVSDEDSEDDSGEEEHDSYSVPKMSKNY